MSGTYDFLLTTPCRVAIARVIRRRRVILQLVGNAWLVQRIARTVEEDELETIYRLGGDQALELAIDAVFERAPKRKRPKCLGAPYTWDVIRTAFPARGDLVEEVEDLGQVLTSSGEVNVTWDASVDRMLKSL